jgi:hypothetical protein
MNKKLLTFCLVLALTAIAFGAWFFLFRVSPTVITEQIPVAAAPPAAQDITEQP